MKLYGYWRSSASYRVRIGLALKGISVEHIAVNLRDGSHKSDSHMARNPQGYVPVLELVDGTQLSQSLAILEYLEYFTPHPSLLSGDSVIATKIRAASLSVAADISPIQNLSVLNYIRSEYGQDDEGVCAWAAHWISNGFKSLELIAQEYDTPFLMTETPSLVECCIVPQAYNARRFGVDMNQFPKLKAIDEACRKLPAFISAAPENQMDAL